MNGSKIWKIDSLHEIWRVSHHEVGIGTCYALEDSNRYIDSKTVPNPANWTFDESVFSIHQYTQILDFDSRHCIEISNNAVARRLPEEKYLRKSGRMKGQIKIADDFDAPLKDGFGLKFNGDT